MCTHASRVAFRFHSRTPPPHLAARLSQSPPHARSRPVASGGDWEASYLRNGDGDGGHGRGRRRPRAFSSCSSWSCRREQTGSSYYYSTIISSGGSSSSGTIVSAAYTSKASRLSSSASISLETAMHFYYYFSIHEEETDWMQSALKACLPMNSSMRRW